jgi:exodeoxyribonuclease VII large subunit
MNSEPLRFTVSDFIAVINQTFDYAYNNIEIEGEVSSFKVNQGKFVFFDLKDSTGVVNCFMTVWQLRVPVEDGMKVIVSAMPKLTEKGRFSLTVKTLKLSGEGSLKKGFEILKSKLDKEGLFAAERKRSLPVEPSYIGLISSTQAAGYADFIDIINKRWGGMRVEVAHVQVQGDIASDQIINAINYFNQLKTLPEVLVVIRGGGSVDDLAVFNDEKLVRSVVSSRIPTLVGVGHETDVSLCDLVADVSAITPSNAAQILVPDRNEILRSNRYKIQQLPIQIENCIDRAVNSNRQYLLSAVNRIENDTNTKFEKLLLIQEVLKQINPSTILKRGYSIVRGEIRAGATINVETDKIIYTAEVKNVESK